MFRPKYPPEQVERSRRVLDLYASGRVYVLGSLYGAGILLIVGGATFLPWSPRWLTVAIGLVLLVLGAVTARRWVHGK